MITNKLLEEIVLHLPKFSIGGVFSQERYKRFTELAILFEFFITSSSSVQQKNKNKIGSFLHSEMSAISEDQIFKNFYISYGLILPYVSIRKWKKIETLESALDLIISNRYFPTEAPPHRAMEWEFLLFKTGRISKMPIKESALIRQEIYLPFVDRDLTYALTHTLFYITNFGLNPHTLKTEDIQLLKFQLECLLCKSYEENDVDLNLELAINYFSLLPIMEIDFNMLRLVKDLLLKTDFVQFNCNDQTFEKKYHTYFVLGIFARLLENQLTSEQITPSNKRHLKLVINETNFFNINVCEMNNASFDIKKFKPFKAWTVLKDFKNKTYSFQLYLDYLSEFGIHEQLSKNLYSFLKNFSNRNKLDILWQLEFKHLKLVNQEEQESLKTAFDQKIETHLNLITV